MYRERDLISVGPRAQPAELAELADGHGRRFAYLRLSVTDVCNFRCGYCLPDGYARPVERPSFLTLAEIDRLVRAFAALGLWKVRLTGGEPTLRRDFADIARLVADVPEVRRVAMTTNGYGLAANAGRYRAAGVNAVNVSIDSLDSATFAKVTGHDRLTEVLAGVAACQDAGFEAVKINAVLMRGINDGEADLDRFLALVADRALTVRFIETMRTNDQPQFWRRHHVSAAATVARLEAKGWRAVSRGEGAGPAVDYAHADFAGRIGIIAPYGDGFCSTCNRLRVSAAGRLHLCLFGEGGHDLRPLLQHDDDQAELAASIRTLVAGKADGHRLRDGNSGATPHLASIGG
jgi:GTP 3',8-cyclase